MTPFIDIQRRFREPTEKELEDIEFLTGLETALEEFGIHPGMGWPKLLEHHRVILLAEAGAGKTVEMRKQAEGLVEEGKFAFFVPLDYLDREPIDGVLSADEERRFEAWKTDTEAPAWFFLDAVDELKLTQGKLDQALLRLARAIDGCLHRAYIIISCRPSDWRPNSDLDTVRDRLPAQEAGRQALSLSSDEVFMDALGHDRGEANSATRQRNDLSSRGTVQTVFMLPMSDRQVKLFAEQSGVEDTTAFLEEVKEVTGQDAWSFARRPLDLANLIAAWTSSEGSGSRRLGSRAEQHEANVAAKLKDNPDRLDKDVLSDTEARLGSERLALALALTRTRTLRSPEQTLDPDRSDGVLEPAEILPDWTEAERQALLRRALFDPATYGRVRFHHRSVQEYLAAQRLKALRDRGMSTKALFRLLFAERYGVAVVLPSMRAITAWLALWDEAVCRELIEREPEALLSLGDPATLDIAARKDLVRRFVARYGEGGWHGLHIPIAEVGRLAHPDLASVIRECWNNEPTSREVREVLVELIRRGPVEDCADLALHAAHDTDWHPGHRAIAIRALLACGCNDRVRDIATAMLDQPDPWPDGTVYGVAADLFPGIITADDLITLVEQRPEPTDSFLGFGDVLLRIAETIAPRSEEAAALRKQMADLVWRGRGPVQESHEIHSRFGYLAPALATLCHRQLSEASGSLHDDLIWASVVASRFSGNDLDAYKPVSDLGERFRDNARLRNDAFWTELMFMDEIVPTGGAWSQFDQTQTNSLIAPIDKPDRSWLLAALADESRPERRAVALHALMEIWPQQGRDASELDAIRDAMKGDTELGRILEKYTPPPNQIGAIERMKQRRQDRQREADIRETQRLEDWKQWRAELLADPDDAFSEEKQAATVNTLFSWLEQKQQHRNPFNVWDKNALINAFSPGVAERAEQAFRKLWRTIQPILRSAQPAGERNNSPDKWILGFSGVLAEASTPRWTASLSSAEVRTAAAYATLELQGFAAFLADLVESHPQEVEKVIGGEVSAELSVGGDSDDLPTFQRLAAAQGKLKQLLTPRLLAELKSWPDTFRGEAGPRWARHLDQVLQILDETTCGADREEIALICSTRYEAEPVGAVAISWLKGLFRFDAGHGTQTLAEKLVDSNDPDMRERAIQTFAALFGDRYGNRNPVILEVDDPDQRARILERLVRLAFAFVRPKEDQVHEGAYSPDTRDPIDRDNARTQVHEGTYSPDTRDHAEHVRRGLLSSLLDTPGPEAHGVVMALAEENDFADMADWMRLRARQRAAADAEFTAFTSTQVCDLENRLEAPPTDRDGLFEVMVDRLEDLDHDLRHSDFTDRQTVQSIEKETEMQRTLARRLVEGAKSAYKVTREEEVADGKHTDIRLAAVDGGQKAVIEVKIADRWSLLQLRQALCNQLLGQYLRDSNCKAGCLLLTYHGRKRHWVDPKSREKQTFSQVVELLKDEARVIEQERAYDVRLAVIGFDLTDPSPAPVHGEN